MTEVSEQSSLKAADERRGFVKRHPRLCTAGVIVLLMLIGASLRFYRIDRPALWGDEAATYQRVIGSFDQLMDRLHGEGFVPLHYVCLWALGKITLLTPLMMRLLPAITGVLFIPAVYLLARQLFNRRTSVAAAVMATVGAYGLIYSRDAKMYMETWFFVTLFAGLLLLWWRIGKWWTWPLWVMAGAIAVLFHATALIVVALCPLFLIVSPVRERKLWQWAVMVVLAVVGLGAVVTPPVVYYLWYNNYVSTTGIAPVEREDGHRANWEASGLDWVDEFNQRTGPWGLTANSAANYLLGVQWPREEIDPKGANGPMPGWFTPAVVWAMTGLVGLMVVGAMPWRKGSDGEREAASGEDRASWWRCAALLAAWLILPTYGVFYCRSFIDPAGPWQAAGAVWDWLGWGWIPAGVATAMLIAYAMRWRIVAWISAGLFGALMIGTLGWAMIFGGGAGGQWGTQWVDLLGGNAWLAAVMICCGAAVWYQWSGTSTRQRNMRMLIGGGLAVGLLIICGAAWWVWHVMAEQYVASHGGRMWKSIWMPRYLGVIYPAVLITAAWLFMRLPTRWLGWCAVALFVGLNLTQGVARVEADTEPPFAEAANDAWLSHTDEQVGLVFDAFERGIPGAFMSRERMSYYLDMAAGRMESKDDFDRAKLQRSIERLRNPGGWRLRRYVAQHPKMTKLIVWERFDYDQPKPTDEGVYKTLEPQWRLMDQTVWRTRQFWTWRIGNWYRRMVYEKQPEQSSGGPSE